MRATALLFALAAVLLPGGGSADEGNDDALAGMDGYRLTIEGSAVPFYECPLQCLERFSKLGCLEDDEMQAQLTELFVDVAVVVEEQQSGSLQAWVPLTATWTDGAASAGQHFGCGAMGQDYLDIWPSDGSGLDEWTDGVNGVPNVNVLVAIQMGGDGELEYTQKAADGTAHCLCDRDVVEGMQKINGRDPYQSTYEPQLYEVTDTVNAMHNFYHAGSDEFDPTDPEYGISVAGFFIFIMIFGILAMIIMWCNGFCSSFQCHRNNCECCYRLGRTKGKLLTIVTLIAAAAVMLLSYHGRQAFHDSVGDFSNLMRMGSDIFVTLEEGAESMAKSGKQFTRAAGEADCVTVGAVDGGAVIGESTEAFEEAAGAMYDLLCPLEDAGCTNSDCARKCMSAAGYEAADNFENKETGMPLYVDLGIVGLTIGCWVLALLAIGATLTDCVFDDIIINLLGSVILILTFVLCAFLVSISVTVADFCYGDPVTTMSALAEQAGVDTPMIPYYAECKGPNPFGDQLNQTVKALQMMNNTALILGSPIAYPDPSTGEMAETDPFCSPDGMAYLRSGLGSVEDTVADIGGLFECEVVNPIIKQITDEIMCGTFLDGVYFMWVVLMTSGSLMWLAFMFMPMAAHEIKDKVVGVTDQELGLVPVQY